MGRIRKAGSLPNSGKVVGRRLAREKYVPFFDRAESRMACSERGLEIAYLKDPIDLLVVPDPGLGADPRDRRSLLRLNYEFAQWSSLYAGRPYPHRTRHHQARRHVDAAIRKWMEANPDEGQELRRKNKSFVFFRKGRPCRIRGSARRAGVPLTARRSIAVDRVCMSMARRSSSRRIFRSRPSLRTIFAS